jgi:hypothetical protein
MILLLFLGSPRHRLAALRGASSTPIGPARQITCHDVVAL